MRDEERVLRANVQESERHVSQREREAEAARSELEKCRSRYLEVVNETLVDYRRRVREIAEIAGVTSEVEIPKLINDDRLLDEARIGVGFGFDGKDPLPLGNPSFSGGQQVIAGLILLMAMAETERHGFFMLDEPFAHLSLDRIDHVGRFLRSTPVAIHHHRSNNARPRSVRPRGCCDRVAEKACRGPLRTDPDRARCRVALFE